MSQNNTFDLIHPLIVSFRHRGLAIRFLSDHRTDLESEPLLRVRESWSSRVAGFGVPRVSELSTIFPRIRVRFIVLSLRPRLPRPLMPEPTAEPTPNITVSTAKPELLWRWAVRRLVASRGLGVARRIG